MPRAPSTTSPGPPNPRVGRALLAAAGLAFLLGATPIAAQTKGAGAPPSAKAPPPKATAPTSAKDAGAASKTVAKPGPPKKIVIAAVTAELASPDTLAAGLADVEAAGPTAKKLAPRVEELLAKGLKADLTVRAIAALGAIGSTSSSPVIAPYVRHRAADIRKAAALALARTSGPDAAIALRRALRSSDPEVRSIAASGLGRAGDAQSIPDLALALDRGIQEAGPSIAALCTDADCAGVTSRMSKLALDKQQAVLEAMLRRKPVLPEAIVLGVIEQVRGASGEARKTYFSSLHRSFRGSLAVSKALDAAARWTPPKEPARQVLGFPTEPPK